MIFRELNRAAQMWIPQVEYVDDGRPLFVLFQTQNVITIPMKLLETFSMSEKALKMLLNIFDNVNAAARLAWGQLSILK